MEVVASDPEDVVSRSLTLAEQAKAFLNITTDGQYGAAAEYLKGVKLLRKEIADYSNPVIKAFSDGHRLAIKKRDEKDKPLAVVEGSVKRAMAAHDERKDEERRRLVAQAMVEAAKVEQETGLPVLPEIQTIEKPKVAGISHSISYRAEVEDLDALVKAVAEGRAPKEAVVANVVYLNGLARAQKDAFSIPGVKVIASRGTSVTV